MNKKALLEQMEAFSQQFMVSLAEFDAMRKKVQEVFEENARLRMENTALREHLSQLIIDEQPLRHSTRGKEHMESIYEEGFHVCNDFYGQHRENKEDCAFCMELLYSRK
ncbi:MULTISPECIES: DNA replication initiation control protein YabA [Streptococcus]|uniref:DNA replication initiation control protein YabA n=1 Tax=Streptococcus caledonicus TaxID=2614158 RepID=A0ABW0UEV1_9STRE|nr:DNA replication initiation control protein YabA [Streptococcus sp. S784/96/1]